MLGMPEPTLLPSSLLSKSLPSSHTERSNLSPSLRKFTRALEVAIFLYREGGLAKVIDEHDIAIDVVYLRVENPASIGRNRQAPIHGAKVAIYIHYLPDLPG
jgi:hypothetical protein